MAALLKPDAGAMRDWLACFARNSSRQLAVLQLSWRAAVPSRWVNVVWTGNNKFFEHQVRIARVCRCSYCSAS